MSQVRSVMRSRSKCQRESFHIVILQSFICVAILAAAGTAGAVRAPTLPGDLSLGGLASEIGASAGQDLDLSARANGVIPNALAAGAMPASTGLPFRSIAYATSSQPRTVTAADLNADGFPDLIVPHNGTRTTLILYGNADGIYDPLAPSTRTLIDGAFNSQKAAVADFNADGRLDIAIVHYFDGVFVWYQNADGTFGSGGTWNVRLGVGGNFNRCVAVGDINGDGVKDLVAVSETSSFTLWLAPGAFGSWVNGGTYGTAADVSDWIELADFNEDGTLDVAVSADDPSNVASVLLGNPGHFFPYFGSRTLYPVGQGPNTCAVADMNNDGHLDVVVQSWFFAPVGGSVSVLLGRGDGTFNPAIINPFVNLQQDGSFAIAAAEMTGDAFVDIVECGGSVAVTPGNGNGTFGTPRIFGCGVAPLGIALADVNLDGLLDIAVTNISSNTVQVLTAIGPGRFDGLAYPTGSETPSTFNFDDRFVGSLAFGDLNGDGHVDLATNHPTPGTVSVLLGAGNGSFGPPADFSVGLEPQAVVMADLDRDGYQDLAVASKGNGTVSLLPGKGDGTFKAKVGYGVGMDPVDVITADVNSDGRLDLITANFKDDNISVLIKNPGAGFKDRVNYAVPAGPMGLAAGDLNGDGRNDIVVADSSAGGFSVLYQAANGKLTDPAFYFTGGGPTYVALADFDRNGLMDIAVSNTSFNRVETWSNGGAFRSGLFTTFAIPRRISAGDLDGDGWQEVFVAGRAGQTFVLYPFSPNRPRGISRWAFGSAGVDVVMSDANEDGSRDLVTLHPRTQSVSVLLNAAGGAMMAAGRARAIEPGGVGSVSVSPNPFNPAGTMKFTLTSAGPLYVRLFDIQGRLVRTLVDEPFSQPGERTVRIDGRDGQGARLASGIYFYRIEAMKSVREGRITILK